LAIVPQFFPWAVQVVGVHTVPGFTVRTAVTVPASDAEMVRKVETWTAEVVTAKVAAVWPCGMTTLDGTLAAAPLLERNTAAPPGGDAMFNVTVPVEELPPATEVGFSDRPDTDTIGAIAHSPGTPAPPQVSPKSQPHVIAPPQPSGSAPHGPPCTVPPLTPRQLAGSHPGVTVSRCVNEG